MKKYFLLLLLCICFNAWTQSGDFILTHYSPKHSEIDNTNFHIIADQNGLMCIANRFGILRFDGRDWEFFQTNSSALSLAISPDNLLLAGCIGEFGKLDFKDNKFQYVPLIRSDTISDHFLQTFILGDMVYFLSERNIYGYNLSNEQVRHITSGDHLNGYKQNNQLYVNTGSDQLLQIKGFEVIKLPPSDIDWGLISVSPSGSRSIGISLEGDLYDVTGKPVLMRQNNDIRNAGLTITDMGWVNDTLAAFATVESGVFFLNVNNPKYFEITDYHSGLPDNEIHDMFADKDGGVWVAHEFGLTRIAPLYPANSYTNFPGLEGNLIEAQRIGKTLWVNTSLGVFYFSQDTSFTSKVFREQVAKKGRPAKAAAQSVQEEDKEPETEGEDAEDDRKKKGFLKGLFNKKNRSESTEKPKEQEGIFKKLFTTTKQEELGETTQFVRRVEHIMTGISYQFHHVPGTDGKFKQLISTPKYLLATSHTGIFEITKKSAQQVINERVKYAFALPNENKLLVSTEDGYLKSYVLIGNIWMETSSILFKDIILNIYQDSKGRIWMGGTSHIYLGHFEDNSFTISGGYEINNRFYDQLSIWENDDKIVFINSQGYFIFDETNDKIVKETNLADQLGMPHHHLQNEQSRIWLFNGKLWSLLSPDGSVKKFDYLGVYPDLKYISYDHVLDRYWLITQDNQLLAYDAGHASKLLHNSKLFVKRLTGKNGEIRITDKLKLSHDHNYLSIELLKPDYLGLLNPEYQYKLQGLNTDWSNWTHANLIDYSYIPPGSYQLLVRARDSFGDIEEGILLDFSIGTPYWQQPWFYLIQVIILAGIVVLTNRLNEEKRYNKFIKHGLSILTLVVVIEFLQAVIGGYMNIHSTPVIDFLVDVGTAILVFPLEWILRKLMLEGGVKTITKKQFKGSSSK